MALLVSSVVLAGCNDHHAVKTKDNPLLTAKPEDTALLLYRARGYANQHTRTSDDTMYLTCLMHPNKTQGLPKFEKAHEKDCDRFIKSMVDYSHKSKEFNSVTYSDLASKGVLDKFLITLAVPLGDEESFKSSLPLELHSAKDARGA